MFEKWQELYNKLRRPSTPVKLQNQDVPWTYGLPDDLRVLAEAAERGEAVMVTGGQWAMMRPYIAHRGIASGVVLVIDELDERTKRWIAAEHTDPDDEPRGTSYLEGYFRDYPYKTELRDHHREGDNTHATR